ncbi:MAG: prephenate/arogenate dehydrogenase family protein [Micavibrio aeruginosavorus]|uniref:prephenate dehydrogenase n=1 Tax=Micavibrio aeruginosavorus TaxID=349221 RepID=A0A7T5R142_9BACT|nr:MAG: prephenate/arogenate dehydrogenase family protein [Micavibrio aeruginosavorus]
MNFNQVTIIGFGLIGSSIARVLRRDCPAVRIVCGDSSLDVCKKALELGIANSASTDLAEAVQGSDLVVLAVPVGACGGVAEAMAPGLKQGAVVTDVGSVKQAVIASVKRHLPDYVDFVPAHPIAGTEHSGPEAGFAELFQGRWAIITPLPETPLNAIETVTALWESAGSNVEFMEPRRHDLVLAITSHLPHLIAYTIVGTASDLEDHLKADVIKFSASGFRDFTRIAASDPVMWRDIFINNQEAVLEIVQRFTEDLTGLQRAIRWGDGRVLQDMFARTRAIRRQIIDAKQADYRYPNQLSALVPQPEALRKASGS